MLTDAVGWLRADPSAVTSVTLVVLLVLELGLRRTGLARSANVNLDLEER